MCILLTTTHSCNHTLRSAIPCGSKSLACGSTFDSRTVFYACPDCQFILALSLEAKHSRIGRHSRPQATCGIHDVTIAISISDSRAEDFLSALSIGSQEPAMGWNNLRRTRALREEAEILERTNPNYLADRRAPTSSLSSLGSTASTPSAFADTVLQDRQEPTSSLSSSESTVSTPSAFADPASQRQTARPNARKRPRQPELIPEDSSSDSSSDDDPPPPPTCTRHASRPTSYQASRCTECTRIRSGTQVVHPKPADIVEDGTRADMKSRPTWRGWVPVTRVPVGEFQRLPKFDRRGLPIVDNPDAPATRSRPAKRRKTTREKRPRGA